MGILVSGLELVTNARFHMLNGKEADVLSELAGDTLEGVENIGEVRMDSQCVTLLPMESVTT